MWQSWARFLIDTPDLVIAGDHPIKGAICSMLDARAI
jgi:hypothetical protein